MSINTSILKRSSAQIELAITIAQDLVAKRFGQVYTELATQVQVKGFRPGHAPRAMVLDQIGGRILEETLNRLLAEGYREAMVKEQVTPVGQPAVTIKRWAATADGPISQALEYTVATEIMPPVDLGDYQSLRLPTDFDPEPRTITSQDVDKVLNHLRRQKATPQPVEPEHQIVEGDLAIISYTGKVKGVEIEGLANQQYPVVVGSKTLLRGFEDQLLGLAKGESKVFELTLPETMRDEKLVGQAATFDVRIGDLKRLELPLDDQLAVGFGLKNLAALRKQIETGLKEELAQAKRHELEQVVLDLALGLLKIELPNALIEEELDRLVKRLTEEAGKRGLPWPIYLEKMGKTEEQVNDDFRSPAEHNVRVGFLLREVIDQEGIDASDQQAARLAVDRLVEIAQKNSNLARIKHQSH